MFNFTANGGHIDDNYTFINGHNKNYKKDHIHSLYLSITKIIETTELTILFHRWITTILGICTYQFTSPDRSTLLIFLVNKKPFFCGSPLKQFSFTALYKKALKWLCAIYSSLFQPRRPYAMIFFISCYYHLFSA